MTELRTAIVTRIKKPDGTYVKNALGNDDYRVAPQNYVNVPGYGPTAQQVSGWNVFTGNIAGIDPACAVIPNPTTGPPVWVASGSNQFIPDNFTRNAGYSVDLNPSAITLASGTTLASITMTGKPAWMTFSLDTGTGIYHLYGSVPSDQTDITFTLIARASNGLTTPKTFTIFPILVPITGAPVWVETGVNTFVPPDLTVGTPYLVYIPITAVTVDSGTTFDRFVASYKPTWMNFGQETTGAMRWYLSGTAPAGTTSFSFTLGAYASNGKVTYKGFNPGIVDTGAPTWVTSGANLWTPPNYIANTLYEVEIPHSAITPATGTTFLKFDVTSKPAWLSFYALPGALPSAASTKFMLSGTPPAGVSSVNFTAVGYADNGKSAAKSFTISAITVAVTASIRYGKADGRLYLRIGGDGSGVPQVAVADYPDKWTDLNTYNAVRLSSPEVISGVTYHFGFDGYVNLLTGPYNWQIRWLGQTLYATTQTDIIAGSDIADTALTLTTTPPAEPADIATTLGDLITDTPADSITKAGYSWAKNNPAGGSPSNARIFLATGSLSLDLAISTLLSGGGKSGYTTMNAITTDSDGYNRILDASGAASGDTMTIYVRKTGTTTDLFTISLPTFPGSGTVAKTQIYP